MTEETHKRWSPAEVKLLQELVEQGLSADEIFRGGKFPERTHKALSMEISRLGFVEPHKKSVETRITEQALLI